jgi:lipoate-protein ligase B
VPYAVAARFQAALVEARLAGAIPDTLLVLEHTPAITLGTSAKAAHLVASPARLRRLGVEVHPSPRGGDVTYHGPGQLVLYPILALAPPEQDLHAYVARLEELGLAVAARHGVSAFRRAGKTGVWTDRGKLAAIGVRIRRWVTSHGLSFNVSVELGAFGLIVPCGLHGEAVTSLGALLAPRAPSLRAVRAAFLAEFPRVFGRPLRLCAARHEWPAAYQWLWRQAASP